MTNSTAVLATIQDPFRPMLSRKLVPIEFGKTISDHLFETGYITSDAKGINRIGYFYVTVNGKAVLQKDWNTVIGENDFMAVWTLPQGGGGGGSNIGMILITVVMVAAAVFSGGATLGVALAWGAAAGVAVGLLSSMIPQVESPSSTNNRGAASPTYSISAQGNAARLNEAIPVQYGRMRTFPAFAAQPYTENNGNQTFVYQLFCLGQGKLSIEKLQIEDSDFSGFGEIQSEVIQPGGNVTLFPDNVVTSDAVQGLEMLGPNQPGYEIHGPFSACPPGMQVNFVSFDVQLPQGAFRVDADGNLQIREVSFYFEVQPIDDTGTPTGVWTRVVSEVVRYRTQTAQMLTFKVPVPLGRYQAQGARQTEWSSDTRIVDKVIWSGLRAYAPSTRTYGNVTMLATIIRASNNLNSSTSRKINVISTRMLPTWDPVNGWGPEVPTRNPAWAYADALRNSDYGAGWPTTRLNIVEIYRLAQVWESRGDQFNGVFDSTQTMWAALTQIASVGRAMPAYYAGMMDIVRDEPKTIPAQIFTPSNILENSFKTSYKLGTSQTPDHVIVDYFDEEVWQETPIVAALPGASKNNPYSLDMSYGITNGDQAWREGMYKAAVNRDQRGRYNFITEMEGLLLQFGDLIHVSHDVPAWGSSGKVISLNKTTGKIVTTEPMNFTAAPVHQVAFRKKNGRQDGPYNILPDPNQTPGVNSAIVQASPSTLANIFISDGVKMDLTSYAFGPSERAMNRLVVLAAKPNNKGEVSITACDYVDSVHVADQGGDVPLPPPISDLPGLIVGPIIGEVRLELTTDIGKQQIIATSAAGAIYYEFECKTDTGNWQALGTSAEPFMFTYLSTGSWQVRVRGVGAIPGPWASWSGTIDATSLPLPSLDTFVATSKLFAIGLNWSVAAESSTIVNYVEVYSSITDVLGNATRLIQLPYPASSYEHINLGPGERRYYWARAVDQAGRIGPWFNNSSSITQIASNDADKILEALTGKIERTQLGQELLEDIDSDGGAMVEIEQIKTDLAAMYTIKTQLTVNGVPYLAGIGVGVENNEGVITSQILMRADRLSLLNVNAGTGTVFSPFTVEGANTYLANAFIKNGSINYLKVGDLQSDNYAVNSAGWRVAKDGTINLNGLVPGGGRLSITNQLIQVFDGANTLRVRVGIW